MGAALLNKFLEIAIEKNIKFVELEVRRDNKKAVKFYQKYGFEIVEMVSKFYQNGEDAYIMKREI